MTVIERLKSAGYDPENAIYPVYPKRSGTAECSRIRIHCHRSRYDNAFCVTASAFPAFNEHSPESYVILCFPPDMEFGSLSTDLVSRDSEFRYRVLSRCIQDCKYFLGEGQRFSKYLWGGNVQSHIKAMRILWSSFPEGEKPEWISLDEIERFSKEMVEKEIY